MLGIEDTYVNKVIFMALITGSHALINHLGIRTTTRLTDLSGYLILGGSILLTGALFYYAKEHDFTRLWTFTNYSGDAGGGVWPQTDSMLLLFGLGLLLPIYTLTGYDASAHTSEETHEAARKVPTAIIHSVFWAVLAAWLFSSAFIMAIPDMKEAAAQGWNVFFFVMDKVIPQPLKLTLYGIILVCQYICGLATVTSVSRMIFAFARDNGLPFSNTLKKVSPKRRVPVTAIWVGAVLATCFVAYADAYSVATAVTSIALYASYAMPIAAGMLAYGGKWKQMGPFDIGPIYRIVAFLCIIVSGVIFFVGTQPPNEKSLIFLGVIGVITLLVWFALEMRRFKGPPISDEQIAARAAEIAAAEKAVGETA